MAVAMIPAASLVAGQAPAVQPDKTALPTTTQRSSGEWARSFEGLRHFTQPSRDATMGFSFPTEVREVLAKGGDRVVAGAILVRARDAEAVAAVRQQEKRAQNDLEVRAATNKRDLAQIEFDAIKQLSERGGGSNEVEFRRSRNTLEATELELLAAQERFEDQALALERLKADLERYRLVAPFDGVVESVKVDVGAAVGDAQPVLRVVNIDRLWLAVPTPTTQVMSLGLKPGDAAWVLMDTPEDQVVLVGKVIEVSPVAEFASQSTIVKVEIENPRGRPAGLTAWVRFTEPTGAWQARIWEGERVSDASGGGGEDDGPAPGGRGTQTEAGAER